MDQLARNAWVKLTPQQLIVNNPQPTRVSQPEPVSGEPVGAVDAVARSGTSYSHNRSHSSFPELYSPTKNSATDFYQQTARLEADAGELIGVDTYA